MKILLATQPMPAAIFIDAIRARAPELELVEYRSALGDADLADVDVLLGWQMPRGLLARLPRLRWVCSVAAGVARGEADATLRFAHCGNFVDVAAPGPADASGAGGAAA